jgi:hypothetical protein
MSFFDSKQEVINIELTQYGKELFAKGLFEPKYYAFFDDDIIYDFSYCNITEQQNDIETRILQQSVYLKPVYNFNDREAALKSKNDVIPLNFDYKRSIGTLDAVNNYMPSWDIKVLNGSVISNVYTTKSMPDIIQIDLSSSNVTVSGSGDALQIISNYLLLEIEEKNVVSQKDNFEIELYEVTDVTSSLGDKVLNQINFAQKPLYIKNNIMLDDPIIPTGVPENDPALAEYYFEINTDTEINPNIINNIRKNASTLYNTITVEE